MSDFFRSLFVEVSVTQSLLVIVLTVAIGLLLADKLKIKSMSLGVTWILFTGIVLSHFGLRLEPSVARFVKDFGLILFVYSLGLQVGPSFFSSFGKAGLKLNILSACIVVLACVITYVISLLSGVELPTMVGVMSGAVVNTPSLGAAEQAYLDTFSHPNSSIAAGYAVAYPLGVIGVIFSMYLLKVIFRVDPLQEEKRLKAEAGASHEPICIDLHLTNSHVDGITIQQLHHRCHVDMVVSRIIFANGTHIVPTAGTRIELGDTLRVLCDREHLDTLSLLGDIEEKPFELKERQSANLISRRIVVTKPEWNGKQIRKLNINDRFHVTITRVNRAGIDILATSDLHLQLGDRLMVVGDKEDVEKVAEIFGNELKRLDIPNLFPIFIGLVLGVVVGMLPIALPGLSQPFKLGLAGGSLIVAILVGRFGPYHHLVTFSTTSANMMIREVGISLFLAVVGLEAGVSFVPTIVNGGYMWVLYGVIITVIPVLLIGFIAKKWLKVEYFSLLGLLAGSTTNPIALSYGMSEQRDTNRVSVAYATVYPLTMFLRVMAAQLMILLLC